MDQGPSPLPDVTGYEEIGELGRGGMDVVYKAWQQRPRRLVALKMILAGREQRARLRAEADAIARLQHPHIVRIYEAAEHAGTVDLWNLRRLRGDPAS